MKTRCFLAELVLLFSPLLTRAYLISGTVLDSGSGSPIAHAVVGVDSSRSVLTDSDGNFFLNTATSGLERMGDPTRRARISWEPSRGGFSWPANSGAISIEVRNSKGAVVADAAFENRQGDTKWPLDDLPGGVYFAVIRMDGASWSRPIAHLGSGHGTSRSAKAASRLSADPAGSTLTFRKATYLTSTRSVTGDQSGMVVRLSQDHGRSRHPFLYAGEYQGKLMNNQKMYLVRDGKIDWTFNLVGNGQELDDAWLLSNGTIVYSRKLGASGMTMADQKQNWSFANGSVDVHTCQPLDLDRVLVMANGNPAQAIIYNTKTKAIERTFAIPTATTSSHAQVRLIRMTKNGTLLVPHMDQGKVVEYDTATMKPIWTYATGGSVWGAVRLKNGNTLVTGNSGGWVREVNRAGKVVWEIGKNDLAGITLQSVQQANRLENGNTVICSWNGGALGTDEIAVVEVTPDKKVVWQFPVSWLGPATSIQLLDEPGVPENPGDQQR